MALKPITLGVKLFLDDSAAEGERSRRALTWLMLGVVALNREWMERYPETPQLYDSAVVYRPEVDTEEWQDIPTTLQKGWGDCEDLACFRAGQLQAKGVAALPYVTWRRVGERTIFHALVRWPNGLIEDPSLALGMHGAPITRRPMFIGSDPP
jgi:hypothetical protein